MKKMTYYYAATRSLACPADIERESGAHVILPWYKSPVWAADWRESEREEGKEGDGGAR